MDFGDSFQQAMDKFVGFLPNLLGFLVLLLVGYIIARLIAAAVRKVLETLGVDRRLHETAAKRYIEPVVPGASPARGISRVVFWLVFAFFIFAAISVLRISALTDFMNDVLAYLPNVIVAILIFVAAALLASAVANLVNRTVGDTPTGKVAQAVLPALVMVIAMFMILQQLKIAEEIVQIAFAATIGALALGLALAFGLGGRPVAERMLEDAYRKNQENRNDVAGRRAERQSAYASSGGESGTGYPTSTQTAGASASGSGAHTAGVGDSMTGERDTR
jgi:hypothetical protein